MVVKKYTPKRREPEILTVPEAGKLMGIGSARSAYRAARRGEIPGVYAVGRRKLVWMPVFRKHFPEAGR